MSTIEGQLSADDNLKATVGAHTCAWSELRQTSQVCFHLKSHPSVLCWKCSSSLRKQTLAIAHMDQWTHEKALMVKTLCKTDLKRKALVHEAVQESNVSWKGYTLYYRAKMHVTTVRPSKIEYVDDLSLQKHLEWHVVGRPFWDEWLLTVIHHLFPYIGLGGNLEGKSTVILALWRRHDTKSARGFIDPAPIVHQRKGRT